MPSNYLFVCPGEYLIAPRTALTSERTKNSPAIIPTSCSISALKTLLDPRHYSPSHRDQAEQDRAWSNSQQENPGGRRAEGAPPSLIQILLTSSKLFQSSCGWEKYAQDNSLQPPACVEQGLNCFFFSSSSCSSELI